jgi:hypothetical protein
MQQALKLHCKKIARRAPIYVRLFTMKSPLILYGTLGCHLCELAGACVMPVAARHQLKLDHIDIAENADLDAYETRIPVLKYGQQELDWPFDAAAVNAFISSTKI